MSWMQKLYETYEKVAGNKDIPEYDYLCPVGYSMQNAHIEIVIDGEGNFKRAFLIDKKNAKTLIPVTEKSVSRTTNDAPHPLCDSLQYCAKDYPDYGGKRKSYFPSYIEQLGKWCQSDYSHPKAKSVYEYTKNGNLIADLKSKNLLAMDDNDKLVVEYKNDQSIKNDHPAIKLLMFDGKGEKDQAKLFLRWSVECNDELCSHTWEDQGLFNVWLKYVNSLEQHDGFCYITGENVGLAKKHPGKLRHGGDGAKLISSNDTSGYTFKGKFTNSEQVIGVSSEVTQKAHSALRWLIGRKQAFRNGDQVFISWSVQGKEIPDPWANSLDLFGEQDFEENSNISIGDVGQSFAKRLNNKIAGYRANINDTEEIVVMGLDSASPGRLAIIFYRELTASEFLERIERWHHDFAWYQNFGKEFHFVGTPAPKEIAQAAFGNKAEGKNGIKLLNSTVERILPCIVDGASFPKDLVESAIRRSSNRSGLESWQWEKCLGIACSLYKGINKKRSYKMPLEEDCTSRDYLYGRLFAVAEKIESMALYFAGEKRETTAARLMQRFSDRPFSTWRTIETSLVPYKSRINSKMPGLLEGYQKLLDSIYDLFNPDEYSHNSKLSGEYLLGYHCQRKWLNEHKLAKGEWIAKASEESETEELDSEK